MPQKALSRMREGGWMFPGGDFKLNVCQCIAEVCQKLSPADEHAARDEFEGGRAVGRAGIRNHWQLCAHA